MKMNVENKLDKVVKILKEKGFIVYKKGGKEPGVFYAKEGDSRIGFVYPNNGYIYDRIKMWSFSRVYKPHKKTGSSCLMCVSDGFVWKRLSNEKAYKIWVSAENEDFELYKVRVDDESESLIESLEDLQDAFKQDHHVCIEVGKLPYSIGLNYLRNLQELSVEAVEYLTGPKEYSREQAFNIIREWAKEFTEKYGNYDFDGSYYDEIDEFIDKKLGTI